MTTLRLFVPIPTLLIVLLFFAQAQAAPPIYSLTVYGAKMTENNWEELFLQNERTDLIDSEMLVIALSRQLGPTHPRLNYEIEGQVARHFGIQDHWEFNLLGAARWEPFWWDRYIDTNAAFGLGLSYATQRPKAEVIIEGDSRRLMIYWMMELAFAVPGTQNLELVTRIHHRSEAFGILADEGGSNSLGIGLKYSF